MLEEKKSLILNFFIRYPFIASEIFNCELTKVVDMFFISEEEDETLKPKENISARKKVLLSDDEDEEAL